MSVAVVPQLRAAPGEPVIRQRASSRTLGLLACALVVAILCFLSLAIGARVTALSAVWDAIFHYDQANTDHLVIRELRLPRTILGLLVGAALGMAGAVMQGVTRNPLADPGILGVNAGASLLVVIGISAFGVTSIARLRLVRLRRCGGRLGPRLLGRRRSAGRVPPRSSSPWPARP